jgi:hypothetical protein
MVSACCMCVLRSIQGDRGETSAGVSSFGAIRFQLGQMFFRPLTNCFQGFDQRAAERGERVFHSWGDDGKNRPPNESIPFQAAQSLGQHLLRDAIDFALQLCVAMNAIAQNANDESGPFISDAIENETGKTAGVEN